MLWGAGNQGKSTTPKRTGDQQGTGTRGKFLGRRQPTKKEPTIPAGKERKGRKGYKKKKNKHTQGPKSTSARKTLQAG